jgi:hypothetical protein
MPPESAPLPRTVAAAAGLVELIPRKGSLVLVPPSPVEIAWTADGGVRPSGQDSMGPHGDPQVEALLADADIAAALRGPIGMTVVRRRTTHLHDGAPWAVRDLYFPRSVVDTAQLLTSPTRLDEYRVLAEHGFAEVGQRTRWIARHATADETRNLRSGPAPVHVVDRVAFDSKKPICYQRVVIRADRVTWTLDSGRTPPVEDTPPA